MKSEWNSFRKKIQSTAKVLISEKKSVHYILIFSVLKIVERKTFSDANIDFGSCWIKFIKNFVAVEKFDSI